MPINEEDLCQTIIQDLADITGDNYPLIQRSQTGLLDAARSEQNISGLREPVIVDEDDGKGMKEAVIEFMQPASIEEVVTTRQDICDDGEEAVKLRFRRSITKFAGTKNLKFTKASMRRFCESPQAFRQKVILGEMDALFRKINRICIEQYIAGVGKFYGNVAGPKDVQMLDNTGAIRQIDPNGEVAIRQDFEMVGISQQPIVVGAGNLDSYVKLGEIGCCNAFGQDVSDTSHFSYYRDVDVHAVTGNQHRFLAFQPGAVQFASWNENEGDFRMEHFHFDETTVVDPVSGITLDFETNYDRCKKQWVLHFFLNFDLFLMPLNLYKTTHERYGWNGSLLYNATVATPESA